MLNRKVIANLHATSHIQDRWQQAEKKTQLLNLSQQNQHISRDLQRQKKRSKRISNL